MIVDKDTEKMQASVRTEVSFLPECYSPFLASPVFLPKFTNFFICREGHDPKPVRQSLVVFKKALSDEWEDDPVIGDMDAQVLGDDDENVSCVRMVNIGMSPLQFISLVSQDENTATFNIHWPYGSIDISRAQIVDGCYVLNKADFEEDKVVSCTLTPHEGNAFTILITMPFVGFSLLDEDNKKVSGEIRILPQQVHQYTYKFVGSDKEDRFSASFDDDRINYQFILSDGAMLSIRNLKDRLAKVGSISAEGSLDQFLMGAQDAVIKFKDKRWRIHVGGSSLSSVADIDTTPVSLAQFVFRQLMQVEDENTLLQDLIGLQSELYFQWFWMSESDLSYEHLNGLLDMNNLDDDPEKMMQQALLYNRYERFMHKLRRMSFDNCKPIQGDQLQARNNKRKIMRTYSRIVDHLKGTCLLWDFTFEERKEILDIFSTFHREFSDITI